MHHKYKKGAPVIAKDLTGEQLPWAGVVNSMKDVLFKKPNGLYLIKHAGKDFTFTYSIVKYSDIESLNHSVIKFWGNSIIYDKKKNDTKP